MYIEKPVIFFCAFVLIFSHDCLGAGLNKLPIIEARTLNKENFSVPKSFEVNKNVLLISFGRDMQVAIDDWTRALKVPENMTGKFIVYNMPIIPNPGAIVRGFINRGFRSQYKDKSTRKLTVILYVKKELIEALVPRKEDMLQPLVLIVDRAGNILARVPGVASEANLKLVKSYISE